MNSVPITLVTPERDLLVEAVRVVHDLLRVRDHVHALPEQHVGERVRLERLSSSFKCYWTGYRSARFSLMSEAIYPMKTALFKIPEKLLR